LKKNISILGCTGSIGRNTLDIIRQFPDRFKVVGLAAGSNIKLLAEQIKEFAPLLVSVIDSKTAGELKEIIPVEMRNRIIWGVDGNICIAVLKEADFIVSAIVGAAGLAPTWEAVKSGKNIGLANKETLVMAGELIMKEAKSRNVRITPIDSEHSAIMQSLQAGRKKEVSKIILTASGGPFLNTPREKMHDILPEDALNHPNWSMGRKISIDSATLMNKGLEVIEAKWLFDVKPEQIEALVHPQSIVHSMVEFIDGSVVAQLGIPDMRIPIAYALSWPERIKTNIERLDLSRCKSLSFFNPDVIKFPALKLAYEAMRQGGTMPATLNAANEIAVDAFLEGKIRFPDIIMSVAETMKVISAEEIKDLNTVFEADKKARNMTMSILKKFIKNSNYEA
jgi:1-deoxy-D-xylulose-5-phosphate reductoisomerase